jgi:hypothetical protein
MRGFSLSAGLPTIVLLACGGGNLAGRLLQPPAFMPADQTKCRAQASTSEPLIVEWPSAARAELEAIIENHKDVAVVRYEGCTMRVLSSCVAPGKLTYIALRNSKQDALRITNADDLYANLPVGAASLEGKLATSGELDVDMTLVGRFEGDASGIAASDLQGDCGGATHVIRAVTVGAFDFHTAAKADVGGGARVLNVGVGASSSAAQDDITRDGKVDACAGAKSSDTDPPDNCGALVRIELLPLAAVSSFRAGGASPVPAPTTAPTTDANLDTPVPRLPTPTCPLGSYWSGAACVGGRCPQGAVWDSLKGMCVGAGVSCDAGLHFVEGVGCVKDDTTTPATPSATPLTRAQLEPLVFGGRATPRQIMELRALCREVSDKPCVDHCNDLLKPNHQGP